MANKSSKTYWADFYRVRVEKNNSSPLIANLLRDSASASYLDMLDTLETGDHHQIRNIVAFRTDKVFKAVFGKVRNIDIPVQGDHQGNEEDLVLKPGYGLVEKNYLLYFRENNLLVYQRNMTGSHYSKLAAYLSKVTGKTVALDPVLTSDSYKRLMANNVVPTKIEFSVAASPNSTLYPEEWTQEMMDLVKGVGGARARVSIRADTRRGETLAPLVKEAAVILARSGRAGVSRLTIDGGEHPIDLIADRIIEKMSVDIEGRYPQPESIYNELVAAKDRRQNDLDSFFGT
jgi:hypothetical protein